MSTNAPALPRFSINGNEINPNSPHFQAVDAANTDYIIIQPRHPLSNVEVDELKRLGVEIQSVVARDTLLCKYKPDNLEVLRQCPFLQYVDVYRNLCVINPTLRRKIPPPSTQSTHARPAHAFLVRTVQHSAPDAHLIDVDIVLHTDIATDNEAVLTKLSQTAGVPQSSFIITPYMIQMKVSATKLVDLAKLDEVSRIEKVVPMTPNDVYAERIIRSDVVLNTTGLTGEGQIVAVADTGFDNGTIDHCHVGFQGKISKLISIWRKKQAKDPHGHGVNDPFNHGTHVCGSIVAEGVSSVTHEKITGTAPGAKLVVQSLCTTGTEITLIKRPEDLITMLDTARKDCGAGVHTNSWGPAWDDDTGQEGYTVESGVLDDYIRQNPDLAVCWSAGNDGRPNVLNGTEVLPNSKGQIGRYAASKNVITIGSTVSDRPFVPQLSESPARVEAMQQGIDINVVAYNSSRGPTLLDGRIKPDVVAPGVRILSATTQDPGWQDQLSNDGPPDKLWETMSGTSMATPQVAGCIAVIKQALQKHKIDKRMADADVIKALLVNGAVSLKHTPNNDEGFGRVNLENSIIIPGVTAHAGVFTHEGLTTGEVATFTIDVPSYGQMTNDVPNVQFNLPKNVNLSATLVWLDPRSQVLVNELRFVIVASNGVECHGNKSPGVTDFDRTNNVQKIVWNGISSGSARVTITARNVPLPGDKQKCAVVWRLTI